MARPFFTFDVFTDTALAGNPLVPINLMQKLISDTEVNVRLELANNGWENQPFLLRLAGKIILK